MKTTVHQSTDIDPFLLSPRPSYPPISRISPPLIHASLAVDVKVISRNKKKEAEIPIWPWSLVYLQQINHRPYKRETIARIENKHVDNIHHSQSAWSVEQIPRFWPTSSGETIALSKLERVRCFCLERTFCPLNWTNHHVLQHTPASSAIRLKIFSNRFTTAHALRYYHGNFGRFEIP